MQHARVNGMVPVVLVNMPRLERHCVHAQHFHTDTFTSPVGDAINHSVILDQNSVQIQEPEDLKPSYENTGRNLKENRKWKILL